MVEGDNQKWRRVFRSAGADSDLRTLAEDIRFKHRERLISLALQDMAPVEGLSATMRESLSAEILTKKSTRQFVGLAVGALMAEQGFEPAGIKRIKGDAVFSSGTLFRRGQSSATASGSPQFLERLVSVLTTEEKDLLRAILSRQKD
ncbi:MULTISPECIES: hypothetical protein [unclassified Mesorhizobium]|uniref:hypothetical protein n=1 Tax=unclassified Mesorhizobium TaxID=325217 RepID=UPI0012DCBF5D|nr:MULTISPECIES: hypothetical protein [unclassified Mesorhizobium]